MQFAQIWHTGRPAPLNSVTFAQTSNLICQTHDFLICQVGQLYFAGVASIALRAEVACFDKSIEFEVDRLFGDGRRLLRDALNRLAVKMFRFEKCGTWPTLRLVCGEVLKNNLRG